MKFKKFGIQPP
jgi:hypothetical protein